MSPKFASSRRAGALALAAALFAGTAVQAAEPAPSAAEARQQDLDVLYQSLERYHPDSMAIEELFFNTNITTGIRVAEARGVLLLAARQAGVAIQEYTPLQVKQAVVGYGRAEKQQVISMVTALLGLKEAPKPDDTADALAIAICHAHCGGSRLASYFNRNTV